MKIVLITGALGLTGSEAVKFFKEKGWEVIGVDNNSRAKFFNLEEVDRGDTWRIDITDKQYMEELFFKYKFDAIVHCAAQPSHDYSKDHVLEDFMVNAYGTVVLLELTRKYCPDAVFVNVTTDKVYGENMLSPNLSEQETRWDAYNVMSREEVKVPFKEDLGLDNAMRSPFGCSKTAADVYGQEYARYFGMKVGTFRPGCITGKAHKGAELHGFLAYLVRCIKEGKTYKIFGYKGKQVRDQIHAYDLVNAFWHFIQDPKPGEVYNIGGGPERSVSVLEAIKLIEHETGKKAMVELLPEPRLGDRIWDIHDVSKFKRHYPKWDYKYSLEDIIKDLCQTPS